VVVESVEKPWTLFCMLLLLAVLLVLLDFHHAGQCAWVVSVGIRPCRGRSNCSCFLFQTKEKRVCQGKNVSDSRCLKRVWGRRCGGGRGGGCGR